MKHKFKTAVLGGAAIGAVLGVGGVPDAIAQTCSCAMSNLVPPVRSLTRTLAAAVVADQLNGQVGRLPVISGEVYGLREDTTSPTFYIDYTPAAAGTLNAEVCRAPFQGYSVATGTWSCTATSTRASSGFSSTVPIDFLVGAGANGTVWGSVLSHYDYVFLDIWPLGMVQDTNRIGIFQQTALCWAA